MTLHEPVVTLTDYAMAIEGFLLAWLLTRSASDQPVVRTWIVRFLVAFAATALFGGTTHGFFPDAGSAGYAIAWRATLASLGFTAFCGWCVAASILLPERLRIVVRIAAIEYGLYLLVILFMTQDYLVGVLNYLPAAVAVLLAFCIALARYRSRAAFWGVLGLLLTFVAAAVQTGGIGFHPVYFDHNAFYHLIQGIAVFFVFLAGKGTIVSDRQRRGRAVPRNRGRQSMASRERPIGAMEFSKLVVPAILTLVLFAAGLLEDTWIEALVGLFPDRIEGVAILNQIQLILSWVIGAWIFTRFVNVIFWRGIVESHSATRVPSLLTDMFANVVAVVAIIGILITAFGLSMVHIMVIVAGLTLLLAIFLRKAIEDLFTGISLNFDPSFNIGDVVEVGDGIRGRVQEITWRTARLVTDTQELIAIPNAVIASGVVRNFSRPATQLGSTLRVVLDYSATPERARRILLNAVREACDDNDKCEVHLVELNRQGAVYDVLFWTDSADKAERTRSHVGEVIVRHLEFAGIALTGSSAAGLGKTQPDGGHAISRLAAMFRTAPIFSDLDMATVEELAREAKRHEFQPGHYLYREGDPGDHMFVITEGRVRIIGQREDGTTMVIGEPGPGGTAGVESLLTGEPDKESARVALPTVAYEIGKTSMEKILEKRPEVASKLARKAIEMRRELDRKSNELSIGDEPESQEDVSELLGKIKGVFKSGFLKSLSGYYKDKVSGQTDPVFLEAAMAASALVAAADGEVTEAERRQVASVFDTLDIFAADSRKEGVAMFEGFVTDILANPGTGVPLAMVKVKALAGQGESAETVVRICFAICESDGLTDVDEEKRIREICRTLKLPPHDFGL